ncbi:MAG: aminoacetone oxidase family FAD-binding enzyme [Coriobacteriales bacterium]|jgi:predicted Rossmann fold flavoprotein|nr:aminoacetone oxidase family FAD-binding enzyme [Coriobacteriales bacterium]
MSDTLEACVIGAGAAGLAAAITAAEQGVRVVVLERQARIGQSILKTGNGRCNLTNDAIGAALPLGTYRNQDFASNVLGRWDAAAVRAWFDERGLMTEADERGWVYPRTRMANSVLDVLRHRIAELDVELRCECQPEHVESAGEGFVLHLASGESLCSRAVILAHGGSRSVDIGGLSYQETAPILGPLGTDTAAIRGLDGVRVSAQLSLSRNERELFCEYGELLFRNYGLSGIVAFNLSRYARRGDHISIDLFPEDTEDGLAAFLGARRESLGGYDTQSFYDGMLHPRIGRLFRDSYANSHRLAHALKHWQVRMNAAPKPEQAQVLRGGYQVAAFRADRLEAYDYPGLFAAGECLDVDGPCGGYNLHWAWASGITAGYAAAAFSSSRFPSD